MLLGKRLAEERRRLGMSQEQFAEHLQVGRSAIGMIETGRSGIDALRLAELGKTLGLDVIYVMTGERAAVAVAAQINWELVEGILTGLQHWATKRKVRLGPDKTARALRILYRHFAAQGSVDAELLNETMDIAA